MWTFLLNLLFFPLSTLFRTLLLRFSLFLIFFNKRFIILWVFLPLCESGFFLQIWTFGWLLFLQMFSMDLMLCGSSSCFTNALRGLSHHFSLLGASLQYKYIYSKEWRDANFVFRKCLSHFPHQLERGKCDKPFP